MQAHILGFPRIGKDRHLKRTLEAHWRGEISVHDLETAAATIRESNWQLQVEKGLDLVPVGDFSIYDHVLDTIAMVGAVPARFCFSGGELDMATYFSMARGNADSGIPAMEMTKWFDSNYHYIVPEVIDGMAYRRSCTRLVRDVRRALELGLRPKPVIVGPVTYLTLAKAAPGTDKWSHLSPLLQVYAEAVAELSSLCEWIQIDEPVLCCDMPHEARAAMRIAYGQLSEAAGGTKLLLASYFGSLGDNLGLALSLPWDGLHIDLVRGRAQLGDVLSAFPEGKALSLGLVDGRNIWKTELDDALDALLTARDRLGVGNVMVASSCSLLHCPVDLNAESELAPELRDWMAFAVQKCEEVATLKLAATGGHAEERLEANKASILRRRTSPLTHDDAVRARAATVASDMLQRTSPYPVRAKLQRNNLGLPPLPTTTIGSYPQTTEIRRQRLARRKGELTRKAYDTFIKGCVAHAISEQERIGLDVLVHGEPERNDMVEFFGQQLRGFCFTSNGWVQSYGSRCVKPPIIYGDVSRPGPMTVELAEYAQSLTDKHVKGMLTGPVTILCWSFVRDDLARDEVCTQIALAMRDEVLDLERAGIRIIQIDEAALREGLPLRGGDQEAYLLWAVDCFRLTASGVCDDTQIHTHMCYSEFNAIVRWIARMDADVVSIEASRSNMELLDAFAGFDYPNDIGPGVYDIHSPRVPSQKEIEDLLSKALLVIPPERLWVNPDCGLKTRDWPETLASLKNMVAAARSVRTRLAR